MIALFVLDALDKMGMVKNPSVLQLSCVNIHVVSCRSIIMTNVVYLKKSNLVYRKMELKMIYDSLICIGCVR